MNHHNMLNSSLYINTGTDYVWSHRDAVGQANQKRECTFTRNSRTEVRPPDQYDCGWQLAGGFS